MMISALYIANSTPSKITQAMKFLWFHALLLHELQHSISYGAWLGMETSHSGDWMWVKTDLISFTLHNLYQIPKTHYLTSLTSFPAYWMATLPSKALENAPFILILRQHAMRLSSSFARSCHHTFGLACTISCQIYLRKERRLHGKIFKTVNIEYFVPQMLLVWVVTSLISSMLCPLVYQDRDPWVQLHNGGVGVVVTGKHKLFACFCCHNGPLNHYLQTL